MALERLFDELLGIAQSLDAILEHKHVFHEVPTLRDVLNKLFADIFALVARITILHKRSATRELSVRNPGSTPTLTLGLLVSPTTLRDCDELISSQITILRAQTVFIESVLWEWTLEKSQEIRGMADLLRIIAYESVYPCGDNNEPWDLGSRH